MANKESCTASVIVEKIVASKGDIKFAGIQMILETGIPMDWQGQEQPDGTIKVVGLLECKRHAWKDGINRFDECLCEILARKGKILPEETKKQCWEKGGKPKVE